ncbi:MAG TPA: hypothetical protein VKB69_13885 [Micromonosporaceae bacterium]|nr:hypothetical protein [Micromonosporaceae bacterium]
MGTQETVEIGFAVAPPDFDQPPDFDRPPVFDYPQSGVTVTGPLLST